MLRCLLLWATMVVFVGCTSELAKITPPKLAMSKQSRAKIIDDPPPAPLPEHITFELLFPTNVTRQQIFYISTSTNLIDWEMLGAFDADETPSPTTNWEYTVTPDWNEPQRYWKILPVDR